MELAELGLTDALTDSLDMVPPHPLWTTRSSRGQPTHSQATPSPLTRDEEEEGEEGPGGALISGGLLAAVNGGSGGSGGGGR